MSRRIVAAVAAVLLAAAGAWVVLTYVGSADSRARAGEELAVVLVVTREVPSGTPADDLGDAVRAEQVPQRLVAPGSLADLTAVEGLSTTADLLPGEMLQSGRFGDPAAVRADGSLPAPDGLVEVSASLDTQRAAGGTLVPGDKVGITLTSQDAGASGLTSYSTFAVLHDVLVTRVSAPSDPATGTWTVTVAVSQQDASTVVVGLSAQAVWLSLESAEGTGSTTSSTTSVAITGDDQ
ncbi:Flp pilus assembly protein CpaB [Klenkia sp. PcliD-1-E]|uniref:Flp pilus assembly protein CpaB n=1 Tax=Klenkia sp. PcliD-1-E TaxID=2954492 RepID=UPI0020985F2F|nr:hypothetical protein [Klenkia sp. PcliD-1-E]MCO7219868.1 hypothetical protein [Klenkia sp. PcliD-1-E]